MYVRIARFDGGDRDWDEFADNVRGALQNGGQGTPVEGMTDAITRMMLFVDRESGQGGNLIVCETEDEMRRTDAAFNAITPVGGRGARTSVEIYEVLMDETPAK